jgi:hypothetical protein
MSERRSINLWGLISKPAPPAPPKVPPLVAYFRGDGWSRYGFDGDERGLSPEECAIKWLREFDTFLRTPDGSRAYTSWLYSLTPDAKLQAERDRRESVFRSILDQRPEWEEPRKADRPCDTLWSSVASGRCPLCNWLKVDHK